MSNENHTAPKDATPKPLSEDDAKKLYERMVQLEAHSQGTNEQLQAMHEQLKAIHQTVETITTLQALTEPKETWMPIAPGAYVKGIVNPVTTIMLSVGAGTAVEKTPEQVLATLQEHIATMEELADGALGELKEAHTEMERIKKLVEGMEPPAIDHNLAAHDHHGHDHDHHGHHHH